MRVSDYYNSFKDTDYSFKSIFSYFINDYASLSSETLSDPLLPDAIEQFLIANYGERELYFIDSDTESDAVVFKANVCSALYMYRSKYRDCAKVLDATIKPFEDFSTLTEKTNNEDTNVSHDSSNEATLKSQNYVAPFNSDEAVPTTSSGSENNSQSSETRVKTRSSTNNITSTSSTGHKQSYASLISEEIKMRARYQLTVMFIEDFKKLYISDLY